MQKNLKNFERKFENLKITTLSSLLCKWVSENGKEEALFKERKRHTSFIEMDKKESNNFTFPLLLREWSVLGI